MQKHLFTKKLKTLLIILTLLATSIFAQKPSLLSGEIHGFLTNKSSPYLVQDSLIVSTNQVLIVEPGVRILFEKDAGIWVREGQIIINGNSSENVILKGVDTNTIWKGVHLIHSKNSEFNNLKIRDAQTAFHIKNSQLQINPAHIHKSTNFGILHENSKHTKQNSLLSNKTIAIQHDNAESAILKDVSFKKNTVAFALKNTNSISFDNTSFNENQLAIYNPQQQNLKLENTFFQHNKHQFQSEDFTAPSLEIPPLEFTSFIDEESEELEDNDEIIEVPEAPSHSAETQKALLAKDTTEESAESNDAPPSKWSMLGNIAVSLDYRHIKTAKNPGPLHDISDNDTTKVHDRYKNIWEVPGLAHGASVYLLMQNGAYKSIEFSTDLYSDHWISKEVPNFSLQYQDSYQKINAGNFYLSRGDLYLSGLSILGLQYNLSLFENKNKKTLFTWSSFWGESEKPILAGMRNPYVYKDWIQEGELKAQTLVWGSDIKWQPLRRFDANFGFLASKDELENPVFREGQSLSRLTSDPLQKALSAYAQGNWLFYPGDIELKAQVAIGRSDTADVMAQRAIDKVFKKEGLSIASLPTIRKLMQSPHLVNRLSRHDLLDIFGDYSSLSNETMRDSLSTLIQKAKKTQKELSKKSESSRKMGLDITSQNVALAASLFWTSEKSSLFGNIKYIGANYYSPGSPNQLNNVREFGGYYKRMLNEIWTTKLAYDLNVENASIDKSLNIFGLAEGTRLGLFNSVDEKFLKEHELSVERVLTKHHLGLENSFELSPRTTLFLNFGASYQSMNRPYRLKAFIDGENAIYNDPWFKNTGKDSTMLIYYRDTIQVNTQKWQEYSDLANKAFIAERFKEVLTNGYLDLSLSYKINNNEIRFAYIFDTRLDFSYFRRDSLIKNLDLQDSTWGKMGYHFNSANYTEQKYPISLRSNLSWFTNIFSYAYRYKSYTLDNMREKEWTLSNTLEIPLFSNFITLSFMAEMGVFDFTWNKETYYLKDTTTQKSYYYYRLKEDQIVATNSPKANDHEVSPLLQRLEGPYERLSEKKQSTETEKNLVLEFSTKINHSTRLFSEWAIRSETYLRPSQISNEYKNLILSLNLNYSF